MQNGFHQTRADKGSTSFYRFLHSDYKYSYFEYPSSMLIAQLA